MTYFSFLSKVYQNPHASSRDTNDRNCSEEEGDEDGQVHEDHDDGVDGDPLSWKRFD